MSTKVRVSPFRFVSRLYFSCVTSEAGATTVVQRQLEWINRDLEADVAKLSKLEGKITEPMKSQGFSQALDYVRQLLLETRELSVAAADGLKTKWKFKVQRTYCILRAYDIAVVGQNRESNASWKLRDVRRALIATGLKPEEVDS